MTSLAHRLRLERERALGASNGGLSLVPLASVLLLVVLFGFVAETARGRAVVARGGEGTVSVASFETTLPVTEEGAPERVRLAAGELYVGSDSTQHMPLAAAEALFAALRRGRPRSRLVLVAGAAEPLVDVGWAARSAERAGYVVNLLVSPGGVVRGP